MVAKWHAEQDRVFADDLQIARQIVGNGTLRRIASDSLCNAGFTQEGELDEHFRLS